MLHTRITPIRVTLLTAGLLLSAQLVQAQTGAATAATADRQQAAHSARHDDYRLKPGAKSDLAVLKIDAKGLTPIELRERLTTALKDYMNNPVVTVIVVEATAPTAYVVGEVNHPGPVTLQPNMTVLQALAVAGGLKDFADAKNIRILRKSITGQTAVPFNYRDAIRGAGSSAVMLQPGDTVVVPD
jgi:polysaccharide export outer membrane protein